MAKKNTYQPEHVVTAGGSFTKFFTILDDMAMSYLDTRAEFKVGMKPGFIRDGELMILGFKDEKGRFVS